MNLKSVFSSNFVTIGISIVIIGDIIKTNIIAIAKDGNPVIIGLISGSTSKARGNTTIIVVNICLK